MEYVYLLINFFTILIPFIFSFHPKINFHKTWGAFFPGVFITGLIFVVWDIYFTHLGIWSFNSRYLTGIEIANLPFEEVLFFLCIPYACVFTFYCLRSLIPEFPQVLQNKVTPVLILLFLFTGIINYDKLYTAVTFISLAAMLTVSAYVFKVRWLNTFYVVYTVLLFPFFIVNGILTGTGLDQPVVLYNEAEIIGIRMFTIPLEDAFYGMELILMNLLIYNYLMGNVKSRFCNPNVSNLYKP